MLVAASHIDIALRKLLEQVAPSALGKQKRRSLFHYGGTLGSFGARVDVAYATRLIGRSLHDALHAMRKIRNDLAHHPDSFRLKEQHDRVRRMYELGEGTSIAINRWARDVMMRIKVGHMIEVKHPDGHEPYFKSADEVLRYVAGDRALIDVLDEQFPKYELAIGVTMVAAVLLWHRRAAAHLLGADDTVSHLARAPASGLERKSEQEPPPADGLGGEG